MPFQSLPPERVAAIGRFVTQTTLPLAEIARREQVSRSTVFALKARHGWTRPPGAPVSPGPPRPAAPANDVPGLIAECLLLLKGQVPKLGRGGGASRTEALRAIADTGRTLKELSRIAASLGGPERAAAASPEPPDDMPDDMDDARFAAFRDDLAERFERWREREAEKLLPGLPDATGREEA